MICLSGIAANQTEPSWNAEVALPSDSKITIRWILPPVEKTQIQRQKLYNLKFSVGPDNTPWIGFNNKYLINPTKQYFLELSSQYKDIIQLDNGALFISTPTEFGFIVSDKQDKKSSLVGFQPISRLPIPNCRMFKGTDNCIYFSGQNKTTSKYEIYLLRPQNLSLNGIKVKTLKEYTKIFSGFREISAVSGNGEITFAATGNTIFYIPENNNSVEIVFEHPSEPVKQLQFNKLSGLFYATDSRIGYLGNGGQIEFFKGECPQISLSGKNLYIFCENDFGIVAFEKINDLSRMNFHITEPDFSSAILGISISELLIISFFAIVLAAALFMIVRGRRKFKINQPSGNNKRPDTKQKRSEIMSGKLYVKPPKGVLIAQIIIVPLFMLFGLSFIFLANGEAAIFAAIFVFIWEAACIAILANAVKLLRQGKMEVAEFGEAEDIKEEDFSRKLRDIESLKADGLLSDDEYRRKREEILNKKW
jgi:hypothetical protein